MVSKNDLSNLLLGAAGGLALYQLSKMSSIDVLLEPGLPLQVAWGAVVSGTTLGCLKLTYAALNGGRIEEIHYSLPHFGANIGALCGALLEAGYLLSR